MSTLSDLYQEIIIDHSKHPQNFRKIDHPSCQAEGYNPLCGDRVEVFLRIQNQTIQDASFQGTGCAVCTASASLMTELVKDKIVADVKQISERFRSALVKEHAEIDQEQLGKLQVLLGVKQYPMRVKCATLAWHTLESALKNDAKETCTESSKFIK